MFVTQNLLESYIAEGFIINRIREIINNRNLKKKEKDKKENTVSLSVSVTPYTTYKRVETHSKSDFDKFYKNNDYIIECAVADDRFCQMIANLLEANYDVKTPIKMYVTTGKDMNKIYDLYGDNAYRDDTHHLIIPLDSLKNSKDISSAKLTIKARYFNDVIDNNEYREYIAGRHEYSKQIQWIIDAYDNMYD